MNVATCPSFEELMSVARLESLPFDVESHLRDCPDCRHNLEQMRANGSGEVERGTMSAIEPTVAAPPPPSNVTPIPAKIGKYAVVGELGKGGQGQVFRGLHPTLGRDVAIKWSRKALGSTDGGGVLLASEGKLLAQLDHPGIVRVYDLDTHFGRPFLVMELIRGCDLVQFAARQPLSAIESARLVAQIARAVQAAHARGITHQDIKPENILIDESGKPRLSDFGIARLRDLWSDDREQPIGGTLTYMAPEQLAGNVEQIGPRSDVYALGGVLYFLLTGREPRAGGGDPEVAIRQIRSGEVNHARLAQASASDQIKAIVRKALAPKPQDRYATAEAMAQDIERSIASPVSAKSWGMGVAAAVLAGLTAWGVSQSFRRPEVVPQPAALAAATPLKTIGLRVLRDGLVKEPRTREELESVLPLRENDQIGLSAQIPSALHVGWFALDLSDWPKMQVRDLGSASSKDGQSKVAGLLPLEKSPATEIVLAIADSRQVPTAADVQAALGEVRWSTKSAPRLPGNVLMPVWSEGVADVGKSLIGSPQADPVEVFRQGLEDIRQRLRVKYAAVEGLAFTHWAEGGDGERKATQKDLQELLNKNKGAAGADPELEARKKLFSGVLERLLATPLVKAKYPDKFAFPPLYEVKTDRKEINAYATSSLLRGATRDPKTNKIRPIVMVTDEYMKKIIQGNESILAATMGHEISHIILDHISVNHRIDEVLPTAFSRDEELQADKLGCEIALAANYPYKAGVEMAFKMQKVFNDMSNFELLKGTHPSWNERLALLDRDRSNLWKAMGAFENGYIFSHLEQYKTAESCFQRVVDDFPECAEAWANLGYTQLMQYCDVLEVKDLRKLGIGHFVAGCFYSRPGKLPDLRGPEHEDLWKKAVKNLETATLRDPKLLLPFANLGLAYLVHPSETPNLAKASEYYSKTLERIRLDKNLPLVSQAAFLVNFGVLDLARGDNLLARDHLNLAGVAANDIKGEWRNQIADALDYNRALLSSRGTLLDKKTAVKQFESFLSFSSPASHFWPLAMEKYEALAKETGTPAKTKADFLLATKKTTLRVVPSVATAGNKVIALGEDTKVILAKLDRADAVGVPVFHRAIVKRYPQVQPGVDILGGDQVLAIFLNSAAAPPVILQPTGIASEKTELRIGMSIDDLAKAIKGQFAERNPRSVESPFVRFHYFPGLGVGFRVENNRIAEIVIAQMAEKILN